MVTSIRRDKKTTCSLVVPLLFVMGTKLIQIYCFCPDSQVNESFITSDKANFWNQLNPVMSVKSALFSSDSENKGLFTDMTGFGRFTNFYYL